MNSIKQYFTPVEAGQIQRLEHDYVPENKLIRKVLGTAEKEKYEKRVKGLMDNEAEVSGDDDNETIVEGDECESLGSRNYAEENYDKDSFLASEDDVDNVSDLSSVSGRSSPHEQRSQKRNLPEKSLQDLHPVGRNFPKSLMDESDTETDSEHDAYQNFFDEVADNAVHHDMSTPYKKFKLDGKYEEVKKTNNFGKTSNFDWVKFLRRTSGKTDREIIAARMPQLPTKRVLELMTAEMLSATVPITRDRFEYELPLELAESLDANIGHGFQQVFINF